MHCTPAISIRARLVEMNAKQQNVSPSLSFLPAHIQKKPISCPSNTELAPNMT